MATTEKKKTPTPEAALHAFWTALGAGELDKCLALWPGLVETYGGKGHARVKLQSILRGDVVRQVVPGRPTFDRRRARATLSYRVTLKGGRSLFGTASLHFDEKGKRWLIDGGI